jgi:hypothetical protein
MQMGVLTVGSSDHAYTVSEKEIRECRITSTPKSQGYAEVIFFVLMLPPVCFRGWGNTE